MRTTKIFAIAECLNFRKGIHWALIYGLKKYLFELKYIHNNPAKYRWNLVQHDEDHKYSSAKFYETGIDESSTETL